MLQLCIFSSACFAQDPAILYNQSRFNQTIKYYRTLANSGDYTGYLNLGVVLKDLGHYHQAIQVLCAAKVKFPKEASILTLLGRIYFLNNNPLMATAAFNQSYELTPRDVEIVLMLGLCYDSLGQIDKAAEFLRKAIALDPNNVIAHLSLAEVYSRSNKLSESAQEYKAVNLLDASISHIYSYWGAILFNLGQYLEAYKIYEKMRAADPSNKRVITQLDAIREKLGKSFFVREKDKRVAQKAHKKVYVEPFIPSGGIVKIRVGLVNAADKVELQMSTDYTIRTAKDSILIGQGLSGQVLTVSADVEGKIVCSRDKTGALIADEPVVISPNEARGTCSIFGVSVGKDHFWQSEQDRSYRGSIEIVAVGKEVRLINSLSLEEYLYSVVPSEMLPKWPFEALKAQAVAARSEAMFKLGRHKSEGYDFCAEVHCQSYAGVEQETPMTNSAVDETRGIVLQYKGKTIDAVYSSCCGGHTQDNIFGKEAKKVEYFQGIPDTLARNGTNKFPLAPYDFERWLKEPPADILCNIPEYARVSNFRWVRVYSASEMDALAAKQADVGRVLKISVIKRNASGHISAIKIAGSKATCLIEKELNIRKALGNLRSSCFKVEIKYGSDQLPEQFVFYGGGWGHAVGMCQAGACGLARLGKDYREVLTHYFSGVAFKKIY
jgi:stage II sporulation protein D